MIEIKLSVIDERNFGKYSGVLIQCYPSNEMRMVKLNDEDAAKFNRNLEKDIEELWRLYEDEPEKYQVNYEEKK